MNKRKEVTKNIVLFLGLLITLAPITVIYASSTGDIIIPLFTHIDDEVVTNEGVLKVKGEISGVDVEGYHGKYEEKIGVRSRNILIFE